MAARKRTPPAQPPEKTGEFYSRALSEAEELLLQHARQLQGLDEEIALFRVMLREALSQQPQDYDRLLKLGGFLVRALSARYRISKKSEEDLYQSLLGVLRGVGAALFPERFEGESDG